MADDSPSIWTSFLHPFSDPAEIERKERQEKAAEQAQADAEAKAAAQAEAERVARIKDPFGSFVGAAAAPSVGAMSTPSHENDATPPQSPAPAASAPPPPPAQAPVRAQARPHVSVGYSAPLDASAEKVAGLSQALPAPSEQPAASTASGPQQPADDDELRKEQEKAAHERKMLTFGADMDRAMNTMLGRQGDEAAYAKAQEMAGQGVRDLLQRREALRQAIADRQASALHDPNSDMGRLATQLALSRGLIKPGQQVSASQWGLIKDAGGWDEAQKRLAADQARATAELASREKEGALNRANALQLERERMANERAMKLEDIQAKGAGKGAGLKPMDAQTVEKHSGAVPGADAVADAMQDFDKVGGLGLVGGDSARYKKTMEGRALAAAIARNPLARESLSANSEHLADTYMPSPSDTKQTAAAKLADQMTGIERGLRSRIDTFRAAGVDPSPLEGELQRMQAAKARFYGVANKYLPQDKRQSIAPEGKVHVANAKTGESYFVDPADVPHAKADGFEVVS